MNLARQLYQLQGVELEIEAKEPALAQTIRQLGDKKVVVEAEASLASEKQRLGELERQQRAAEWEIDDLGTKLATAREALYSGRIRNPKELTNLQHEVDGLKARRDQLEEKALGIMERVEQAEANVAAKSQGLNKLETEWRLKQKELSSEKEHLSGELSQLGQKRKMLSAEIDPAAVELYRQLKIQKGRAVARVEQGTCRGCGILLSSALLQRARGSELVRCPSCGRILFLEG